MTLEVVSDEKNAACKGGINEPTNTPPAIPTSQITLMDVLKDPEAIKAIEGLVSTFFTRHGKNTLWDRAFVSFCFIAIIACVGILSFSGKFDPSAGVILGAMAGYLFGKKDE